MVKSVEQQYKLLDTIILPLYGFHNLIDYEHVVTIEKLESDEGILTKLTSSVPDIKMCFPVKSFNFYRTNDQVKNHKQAFSILKKCLEIAKVPYELYYRTINGKKMKMLRLFDKKINILQSYTTMMENSTSGTFEQTDVINTRTYDQYVGLMSQFTTNIYTLKTSNYKGTCSIELGSCVDHQGWIKEVLIIDNNIRNVSIMCGGQTVYEGKPINGNVIPFGVLFPVNVLKFHICLIKIELEVDRPTVQISITKSKYTPILGNDVIYIPWGDNFLKIENNMYKLIHKPHMDEPPQPSPPLHHTHMRGQLKCCALTSTRDEINKLDTEKQCLAHQSDAIEFEHVEDNGDSYYDNRRKKLVFDIPLMYWGDYCTDFVLTFNEEIKDHVNFLIKYQNSEYGFINESTDNKRFVIGGLYDYEVYNVRCHPIIVIEVDSTDANSVLVYNCVLSFKVGRLSRDYRRKICLINKLIINVNKLVSN